VPVRKGQPLFQFDRRSYEYKVQQLEAELAKAKQDVLVLKADEAVATQKAAAARRLRRRPLRARQLRPGGPEVPRNRTAR
jgi:multidrug resistance efflux pump